MKYYYYVFSINQNFHDCICESDGEFHISEVIQGVAADYHVPVNSVVITFFKEISKEEYEKLSKLQKGVNYILYDPLDISEKMTLENFVGSCNFGYLTDDDGIGHYGTETEVSNLTVKPSDVTVYENYRKDFTHVYWYNR